MINAIKRFLLCLALGKRTYAYMCKTLSQDPRLPRCRLADIIVRQDGREVRIEADWLKTVCKLVSPDLTPPVPQPGEGDYK
jgi:hypothetical protein